MISLSADSNAGSFTGQKQAIREQKQKEEGRPTRGARILQALAIGTVAADVWQPIKEVVEWNFDTPKQVAPTTFLDGHGSFAAALDAQTLLDDPLAPPHGTLVGFDETAPAIGSFNAVAAGDPLDALVVAAPEPTPTFYNDDPELAYDNMELGPMTMAGPSFSAMMH
ncbi:MAG: hypothetical protein H6857_04860 [Rhodospirillales bacterium]|nr:hypothetical protein [Rhodospirillales bacterium]